MDKVIKTIIKNKIADLTDWAQSSLVLRKGEIAFGNDDDNLIMKVGDGTKTWQQLASAYPAKSTRVQATLSATSWTNQIYSFESTYPNATYDITVEIDGDSCTSEQCEAWDAAAIKGSPTTNKIQAFGIVPTVDIPIVLVYTKKN